MSEQEKPPVLAAVVAPLPALAEAGTRVLRVGGGTACKSLGSAIVGVVEKEKLQPILEFVGAGACSQAVKGIAVANGILMRNGKYLVALPMFVTRAYHDNPEMTAIQLRLSVIPIR